LLAALAAVVAALVAAAEAALLSWQCCILSVHDKHHMTEGYFTVAAKTAEAASLAQQLHNLLPKKQAIWHVPLCFCQGRAATTAEAKELPATMATAEQYQQRKQRHKERQVGR